MKIERYDKRIYTINYTTFHHDVYKFINFVEKRLERIKKKLRENVYNFYYLYSGKIFNKIIIADNGFEIKQIINLRRREYNLLLEFLTS